MVIKYIIFNFILSVALAAPLDWKSLAKDLLAKEGKEEMAQKKLIAMADLDQQLSKALKKGGQEERLALHAIRKLNRMTLVQEVLQRVQSLDPSDESAEASIVMLASMTDSKKGAEILERLVQKVDLTSKKISAPLKIAVLSGMQIRQQAPSLKIMKNLLDDESYELRQKVVDMLPWASGPSKSKEEFLQKALSVSPYPVRLRAIREIRSLSADAKVRLKGAILKCAQQDENALVKEQCQNFQLTSPSRLGDGEN